MLQRIHHRYSSILKSHKPPYKHVGVLILTNDLDSKEVSRLMVTKNLIRYAEYTNYWWYWLKLYLEKLLLSRRMERMEMAVNSIRSLYEPQNNLTEQVSSKLGQLYPNTKFTFYKKCISDANDVHQTFNNIIVNEVDHLIIFPLKPSYTCVELADEFFDISTYLNENKHKINFQMSHIKPYGMRKDYLQMMANSIGKALKSLQTDSKHQYVLLFLAPCIKLQDIKHGDVSYLTYSSIANNIMQLVNVPNHYVVAWHLNENNEDNFLMPNTYSAIKYLVRNHKKDAFLLIPLTTIFDGRLVRYDYDLDMISQIRKLEPHVKISKLSFPDRNPEMINIFVNIITEHLTHHTDSYPWYLLDKDPDCVHFNCERIRCILSKFFPKKNTIKCSQSNDNSELKN